MNPMELVYFTEDGRLELDHDCEMCNEYPLEDMNEPCLNCGYAQVDLLTVIGHIARANRAIDFYNGLNQDENDKGSVVIQSTLTLSHVSLGGNDCNKLVFSDYEDSPYLIPSFAPFIHHECDVIIYPKKVNDNTVKGWLFGDDE